MELSRLLSVTGLVAIGSGWGCDGKPTTITIPVVVPVNDPSSVAVDTSIPPDTGDTEDSGDTGGWDADGDGYTAEAYGGTDCDDSDATTHPDANEQWNGQDSNCDGIVDNLLFNEDNTCFAGEDRWSLGIALEAAGDLNGDGYGEILAGAPGFNPTRGTYDEIYGGAFVVDGQLLSGVEENPNIQDYSHVITGAATGGRFGVVLAGLGDIDGDGAPDIAMVADRHSVNHDGNKTTGLGLVSMVLSSGSPYDSVMNADQADILIYGNDAKQRLGSATIGYGDTNGDGMDDFGLAGRLNSDNMGMYIYHGRPLVEWSEYSTIDDADGVLAIAESLDTYAMQSGPAGDFNGDGYQDVLVGSGTHDVPINNGGVVYLTFGGIDGVQWREDLDSEADFAFVPDSVNASGEFLGWAMTTLSDQDGDGDDEIALTSLYEESVGEDGGSVYIVLGQPATDGIPGATMAEGIMRSSVSDAADAKLLPSSDHDMLGWALAPFPDIDGDGLAELGVSSPYASSDGLLANGKAWLVDVDSVLGAGEVSIEDVSHLTISGTEDRQGTASTIRPAGDVNGDGLDDLLIAAYNDNADGDRRGRACILFNGL